MTLDTFAAYRSWLISGGIVLAVVLWLATGTGGETGSEDAAAMTGEEPADALQFAVRIRNQVAEEVVRTIRVNGSTAPARTVELKAETNGRVIETGVERGERVAKGGVIALLDKRDREAELSRATATVRQREVEYEARQQLKSDSYVSEAQLKEAAALLESARADLRRAELDIDNRSVRAPFAGALQERHVEVGDFVSPGDPIATFVDERSIIVRASVSEFDAAYVEQGQAADATLATGETVSGHVRYVAPVADASTRTFAVELVVDNEDGALRAGTTAVLSIPGERILAHKISPSLLTLDDEGHVGVKIINDDGSVEFHEADIALSSSDGVWVAGLPAAATIITVGQGFVSVGSQPRAIHEDEVDQALAIKTDASDK